MKEKSEGRNGGQFELDNFRSPRTDAHQGAKAAAELKLVSVCDVLVAEDDDAAGREDALDFLEMEDKRNQPVLRPTPSQSHYLDVFIRKILDLDTRVGDFRADVARQELLRSAGDRDRVFAARGSRGAGSGCSCSGSLRHFVLEL